MAALSGFGSLQALRGGVAANEKKGPLWGKSAVVAHWIGVENVPQLTFHNSTLDKPGVKMTWEIVATDNKSSLLASGSIIVPHKGRKLTYKKVNFPKILNGLINSTKDQNPSYDITISVARPKNYDAGGDDWVPTYVSSVPQGGDARDIALFELVESSL